MSEGTKLNSDVIVAEIKDLTLKLQTSSATTRHQGTTNARRITLHCTGQSGLDMGYPND